MSSSISDQSTEVDFIIVGAGTSGCLLANRLASAPSKPSVALLEAGVDTLTNGKIEDRIAFDRFAIHRTSGLDYGFKNGPEPGMDGRILPYARGKGLGGSSQTNFSFWTVGPSDDYDKWAELVKDEAYSWENVQTTYKKIITVDDSMVMDSMRKYHTPTTFTPQNTSGELRITATPGFPGADDIFGTFASHGWKSNADLNSGDPIGLGLNANSSAHGMRETSATAFLTERPDNLVVITEAVAHKVVPGTGNNKVILADGRIFSAHKEVFLCCGSLDTAKLLLLSGIGPEAELKKHNIPIVQNIPGIGKNLGDHVLGGVSVISSKATPELDALHFNHESQALARKEWAEISKDPSNKWHMYNAGTLLGFHKISDEDLKRALPLLDGSPEWQEYVQRPRVPHFEVLWAGPTDPRWRPDPAKGEGSYMSLSVILQSQQSRGSVTLASADPSAAPVFDLGLLTHPFDRAVAIAAYRHAMKILYDPKYEKDYVRDLVAPASTSDEDILAFVKQTGNGTWHACGTAKMGDFDKDPMACVDGDFRLRGVGGVRVVDASVLPFMVNTHIQSVAYLCGQIAAEKVIGEYGL